MTAALIVVAIVLFFGVLFAFSALRIVREYERAIVFRLAGSSRSRRGLGCSSAYRSSTSW